MVTTLCPLGPENGREVQTNDIKQRSEAQANERGCEDT